MEGEDIDSILGDNIEATDWEIYCEEHEWLSSGEYKPFGESEIKTHCENCGIKKPEENKESIRDKRHTQFKGIPSYAHYSEEAVKEKVQNAQERLMKEMYLTIENANQISKIFKEEFGDKLIWEGK